MSGALQNLAPRVRPLTLRQLAAQIDLDVGTVSRALAGDRRVSRERAEQIRAFAQAAGYRPRPLRRKQTDAIGIVVRASEEGPNTGYLERMVYLAEVGASKLGKHLHVHMLRGGDESAEWPKFLSENRVDGILVVGHGTDAFYQRLHREPAPAVAINDAIERTGIDCVLCDPTPGIRDAVKQLLSLGHRAIGLVLTRRHFPTVSRRYTAYFDAMRAGGIEPEPQWVIQEVPGGLRGGQQAVRTYVAGGSVPSAIIFNDDWIAMGGVYELARHGMRVPDDVSVVGYDNTTISAELSPSVSSVDNREQDLMLQAMTMLEERIHGLDVPPRQRTVDSHLVWRESCARVPPSGR